jgi:TfoX N-terminal domain
VAHDRELAERLRAELEGAPGITEKAMFGGLAFLADGHLAVAASNSGGLLLRVDPARMDDLLEHDEVDRFVMNGRELDGWLHVEVDAQVTDAELRQWIDFGVGYARSLSPGGTTAG